MTIQDAIELFEKHQKSTVKKSTIKSYGKFLVKVQERFLGKRWYLSRRTKSVSSSMTALVTSVDPHATFAALR